MKIVPSRLTFAKIESGGIARKQRVRKHLFGDGGEGKLRNSKSSGFPWKAKQFLYSIKNVFRKSSKSANDHHGLIELVVPQTTPSVEKVERSETVQSDVQIDGKNVIVTPSVNNRGNEGVVGQMGRSGPEAALTSDVI